jgi:hypothetical protein
MRLSSCGGDGFCVRSLLLALGLLVAALAFGTAPASAHADHDDERVAAAAGSGAPASSGHHGGPGHDVDHNPADHSHPIGEDTYHEKASHSSLDFAHYHTITVKLAALPRAASLPAVDEADHGLALTPPIRPPLG